MKYECFQKDITSENDRLEAVKESKSRIRQKECMNKIIEEHKELLFQFRKTEKVCISTITVNTMLCKKY